MPVIYSNNASTSLSAGINNSTTTIPIASASGFPSLGSGEYYFGTIANTANTKIEIVKVTSGTTSLTVTRAQGGTSAQAFDSGDNFQLRVTADTLLAATQTDVKITGGSIATAALADDAVTVAKMAVNSVDSDQYVDGSIDTVHLSADCITGAKIANDEVDSEHIAANSLDARHYAPDSVDADAMAANSIDSDSYVDGSIDTAHIADDQVTRDKMADAAVGTAQLVDGGVSTAKIADDAVTADKLANAINTSIAAKLPLAGGTMTGNILHASDFAIDVGGDIKLDAAGGEYFLYNNGTFQSLISTASEHLTIQNKVSDKDIIFKGKDGSTDGITALTLDMSAAGTAIFNHDIVLGDGNQVKCGDGDDLQILHDHSNQQNKVISASLPLILTGTTVSLNNGANDENMLVATQNAGVALYHNHVKKFETTSAGATVTGTLTADLADNSIDSEHYVDGSIDNVHLANDCINASKIADDQITGDHIGDNVIDSDMYVDGSIDLAHISSQAVDEDNLYISNAGSNGQFLSKQTGNNGGLTWADAGGAIPSGTVMCFFQSGAPTGWTKVTSQNDKVLRVVSGNGGGTGGATSFSSTAHNLAVADHTLATSRIPAHSHSVPAANNNNGGGWKPGNGSNASGISTGNTGGGSAHGHSVSGSITVPHYIDVILCSYD